MPRRKLSEHNIRKVQRSHGTYTISIPIDIARSIKLRERQKVVVKKRGKKITIEDWPASTRSPRFGEAGRGKSTRGGKKP